MRTADARSPRTVAASTRAGRKVLVTKFDDDTEALALRQAMLLRRHYPMSLDMALTVARMAYTRRPS
ncbi:hypothetical protein [Bradyrhizobium manausense]|uniref:Uncharacterized protein n=1 Tax=Bradyrhizobium manausense TaxID=989370 RepID=A0A0R3D0P3_9BRAD|nr:hypothetical protein [Bradyrhizobium manausense]KRQ03350.1 hypothetical protein AOQ71_32015 [Bradyrhizobium manausense]